MRQRLGLLCACLLLIVGAVGASPRPAEAGFSVPFDFMVGRHMFPAGEYRVFRASANAFWLQATRGIASVAVSRKAAPQSNVRPLRLVFDPQKHPPQLLAIYGRGEIVRELAAAPSRPLTVIRARRVPALAGVVGVH